MPAKRSSKKPRTTTVLLLGVGLDAADGHRRVTSGRDFLLVGGSQDTHGLLQERAIKLNEELDRRGKRLKDVRSKAELADIVERAWR